MNLEVDPTQFGERYMAHGHMMKYTINEKGTHHSAGLPIPRKDHMEFLWDLSSQ